MMSYVNDGWIGGGIFHKIHRYAKANNMYLKNNDKNIE